MPYATAIKYMLHAQQTHFLETKPLKRKKKKPFHHIMPMAVFTPIMFRFRQNPVRFRIVFVVGAKLCG